MVGRQLICSKSGITCAKRGSTTWSAPADRVAHIKQHTAIGSRHKFTIALYTNYEFECDDAFAVQRIMDAFKSLQLGQTIPAVAPATATATPVTAAAPPPLAAAGSGFGSAVSRVSPPNSNTSIASTRGGATPTSAAGSGGMTASTGSLASPHSNGDSTPTAAAGQTTSISAFLNSSATGSVQRSERDPFRTFSTAEGSVTAPHTHPKRPATGSSVATPTIHRTASDTPSTATATATATGTGKPSTGSSGVESQPPTQGGSGAVPVTTPPAGSASAGSGGGGASASRLNDYTLIRLIGEGSFGRVLQVRHNRTGAIYAMKVVNKSNATSNEELYK